MSYVIPWQPTKMTVLFRIKKQVPSMRLTDTAVRGAKPKCKQYKLAKHVSDADSFEYVAREWHGKNKANWAENHGNRILTGLEKDIFPWLGKRQINSITPPEVLSIIRRIENRGAIETAHRAMQNCSQVFRYAVATGKAERDPTQDLKGALPSVKQKHMATITEPKEIAQLLRDIDGYHGHFIIRCALCFCQAGRITSRRMGRNQSG